jgi:hypothetical protein
MWPSCAGRPAVPAELPVGARRYGVEPRSVQQESTATGPDVDGPGWTLWDDDLQGRTPVDVLPADGMQEVWGSNPHSSTAQRRNSNDSKAEYSSKVQQRRPVGSRTSVLVRSAREAGHRPELRAARDRRAADRLRRASPLSLWVRPSSYWPLARAGQGDLFGYAIAACATGRPLRWRRGRPASPGKTVS